MALQRHENREGSKARAIPDQKFKDESEKLIERDFFPDLYRKRFDETEVVDLTMEPPLSSEKLDGFNERHIPKSTRDLQQSLSVMKSHRHERMHGIRDPEKLNNFMFNHPGIGYQISSGRPRVNYANTRFPDDYAFEEPNKKSISSRPPERAIFPQRVSGDILERGRKRKGSSL